MSTTMRSSVWPDELRIVRRSCTGHSTTTASSSLSCHGRTPKRTPSRPSGSAISSRSNACSDDVRAPVSSFALIHGTPAPGRLTHSRHPAMVLE